MKDIRTRTAELADLPTLFSFEQGIISAERPFDPTLKPGHINYYDLKEMIESNESEVIVALSGEEIVASGYVKIKQGATYLTHDKYGYIGFMFVKEEQRRKGLSQLILDKLKCWATEQGLDEIRLDVYNDNYGAVVAYEKFGLKKHMITMRMGI